MYRKAAEINFTWRVSSMIDKFSKCTMYQTIEKRIVYLPNGDAQMRHKVIDRSVFKCEWKINGEEYSTQDEAYEFFGHNPAD